MGLDARSTATVLLGSMSIAVVHALIPSHWLAFAVVGRAHRWPVRQTLCVTALAGAGHVTMTVALGFLLASVGKAALKAIPPLAEHAATAIVLIALGIAFAVPNFAGRRGCRHLHRHDYGLDPESSGELALPRSLVAAPSAMAALAMGLTLSPCLDLLPVYVAAAALPWAVIALNSLLMGVTTVGVMVGLVWLTLHGLNALDLSWLERREGMAMGGILVMLGVLLFFL
jgi:hypothetical protein